jgi:tetratricopeptide (TPR) repeat protein
MSKSSKEKNRLKRKIKQKERREHINDQFRQEKGVFYFREAVFLMKCHKYDKAEALLKKSIKCWPGNREMLIELIRLGDLTSRDDLMIEAIMELRRRNLLDNTPRDNQLLLVLLSKLMNTGQYQTASEIGHEISGRMNNLLVNDRRQYKKKLNEMIAYADYQIAFAPHFVKMKKAITSKAPKSSSSPIQTSDSIKTVQKERQVAAEGSPSTDVLGKSNPQQGMVVSTPSSLPEIPLLLEFDQKEFLQALLAATPSSKSEYDLVMEALQIRFNETFDHLLCLNTLSGITSLNYQEETARKVLKTYRGRALLADEVGMGKTIEACMVLKEYMMRQMAKSVLILTPTPLVSQWREELKTKFNLDFKSTQDRIRL